MSYGKPKKPGIFWGGLLSDLPSDLRREAVANSESMVGSLLPDAPFGRNDSTALGFCMYGIEMESMILTPHFSSFIASLLIVWSDLSV